MYSSDMFISNDVMLSCDRCFDQHNGIINRFRNKAKQTSGCFAACKYDNQILITLSLIDDFADIDYTSDKQYNFLKFTTKSKLNKATSSDQYKQKHISFSVDLDKLNNEVGDIFLSRCIYNKKFSYKTYYECNSINNGRTLSLYTMWRKFIMRVCKVYKNELASKDPYTVLFIY